MAVRLAAEITVLPAAEALLQRTPLRYPHAGMRISAQRAVVKSKAVAGLVAGLTAGLTAQPAVVRPTAEIGSKREKGYTPLNF